MPHRAVSPAPRSTSPMPHRAVSPAPRSQSPLPPAPVLLQVTPATMARPVSTALAPTDSSLMLDPPPRRSSNAGLLVPGQLPPRRSSNVGINGSPKPVSPQPVTSPACPSVAIPPRKASSVVAFEPPLINRRKGSVAPPMTLMPLSEDEEDMKRQSRNFSHPQPVPLIPPPTFSNPTSSPSNVNTSSADDAQHSNGEASARPPPLAFQSPVQVDPEDGTYAYDSLFRSYD